MATARDIITRSLRRLRVVGIMQEPPANLLAHGLEAFNDMLTAYEADGLTTETVVITGNIANGSRTVADLDNAGNLSTTDDLVVGMSVSGTGVASAIHKIVNRGEIELTEAATASASGVTLTFTALPMDDSLTEALVSILAVRLSEDFGRTVGPVLARDAKRGQAQIDGQFFKVPKSTFETALLRTPSRRYFEGSGNG